MRIAIFFAMDDEFLPFRNLLRSHAPNFEVVSHGPFERRHGLRFEYRGKEVLVANSGTGSRNAYAMAMKPGFSDRSFFLAAGVSGALTPGLEPGSVLVASRVWRKTEADFDLMWSTDSPPQLPDTRVGDIITSPRVVVTRSEKSILLTDWRSAGRDTPAAVVDMETGGVAWAAHARNISFLALRAVSDTADEDLPLDFNEYLAEDGGVDRTRIAREAVLRPHLIRPLAKLGRNTKYACLRLAVTVWSWLDHLPLN